MACFMRRRIGRYLIMVANSAMSCRTAREPRQGRKSQRSGSASRLRTPLQVQGQLPKLVRFAVGHAQPNLLVRGSRVRRRTELGTSGCRMVEPWRQPRHCCCPIGRFPALPARILASAAVWAWPPRPATRKPKRTTQCQRVRRSRERKPSGDRRRRPRDRVVPARHERGTVASDTWIQGGRQGIPATSDGGRGWPGRVCVGRRRRRRF